MTRTIRYLIGVTVGCLFIQCAALSSDDENKNLRSQSEALCVAEFDATWKQGGGANEWWVEYQITGGTIASASLEIPGVRTIPLAAHAGKWAASAGTMKVATGTQVILHATTTTGDGAQTVPFGYLVQTAPASDPCTSGTDGGTPDGGGTDGGSTDSGVTDGGVTDGGSTDGGASCTFVPTWQQGGGANTWWVEFHISGPVASASLKVVGGEIIPLTFEFSKWRGRPTAAIPSGTSVILRATSTTGETAVTDPFPYLVDKAPVTAPCAGGDGGVGGTTDGGTTDGGTTDGGTTDGGTTCFDPTWQQGGGANEWWVEYHISGPVTSASLKVDSTGQIVPLTFEFTKWRGRPTAAIPSGTTVVLRAMSTAGDATSERFPYLVDKTPETAPCE